MVVDKKCTGTSYTVVKGEKLTRMISSLVMEKKREEKGEIQLSYLSSAT